MSKSMNIYQFAQYMTKYFSVRPIDKVPSLLKNEFNDRSKRFVDREYFVPNAFLNIVEVNIFNFLEQAKMQPTFIVNNLDYLQVFIVEYLAPCYNDFRNNEYDFAHSEMNYDLYVYDNEKNEIVGYLQMRIGNNTFQHYFQNAFIGMIKVPEEYRQKQIASFMMRLGSSYLFYRLRKSLYSGTILSLDMQECMKVLENKTDWVKYKPHFNNVSGETQKRYLLHPIKFNIEVEDSDLILQF